MAKVGVTFLEANYGCLQKEVDKVKNANSLHIDVADGHFVPNFGLHVNFLRDIKTKLDKVVHLMIDEPEKYINVFCKAGANTIIVHLEACENLDEIINKLRRKRVKVGVALNPETKLHWITYYLDKIDLVLIMTANPGFGGQGFDYKMLDKIDELRQMTNIDIIVDCGINPETGKLCVLAGANRLVSGTYVFGHKNPKEAVEILKKL